MKSNSNTHSFPKWLFADICKKKVSNKKNVFKKTITLGHKKNKEKL